MSKDINELVKEHFKESPAFTVYFKTMGNRFCAGEFRASSVDSGKARATELLQNRKLLRLEGAEILDADGKQAAVLRLQTYLMHKTFEWVTVR